jgi:F-type H+-transporting ATPase subunit b
MTSMLHEIAHHPEAYFVSLAILVFLALMYTKARHRILESLDGRIEAVRTELRDARKLHEDARALLADYEKKRNNAATSSAHMIAQAKAETERAIEDAKVELEQQLARRVTVAKQRIIQAEIKARQYVRNTAVEVAVSAAEQLIRDHSDTAHQEFLAQVGIKDAVEKLSY